MRCSGDRIETSRPRRHAPRTERTDAPPGDCPGPVHPSLATSTMPTVASSDDERSSLRMATAAGSVGRLHRAAPRLARMRGDSAGGVAVRRPHPGSGRHLQHSGPHSPMRRGRSDRRRRRGLHGVSRLPLRRTELKAQPQPDSARVPRLGVAGVRIQELRALRLPGPCASGMFGAEKMAQSDVHRSRKSPSEHPGHALKARAQTAARRRAAGSAPEKAARAGADVPGRGARDRGLPPGAG